MIDQWCRQLWGTGAHAPHPRLPTIHFNSLGSKADGQLSKYCVVCEISWCIYQQLTALSISTDKIISHRAAAAPSTEVRRQRPMTYFPALPLLATNSGDATMIDCFVFLS